MIRIASIRVAIAITSTTGKSTFRVGTIIVVVRNVMIIVWWLIVICMLGQLILLLLVDFTPEKRRANALMKW